MFSMTSSSPSIARESDYVMYTDAGPEIAVASTKAYTNQLAAFYALIGRMAVVRGIFDREQEREYAENLLQVPDKIQLVLNRRAEIHKIARSLLEAKDAFMIGRGMGRFADDEPLLVPGGVQTAPCNKLFPQLPEVFSHTRRAYPLIHAGGSVENTVIPCRRVFRKGRDTLTSCREGALSTTVKNFLESSAVRVDPDTYRYDASELHGIDWTSSFCVTVGNAENLTVPMLLMGMTGSYEYIAAEHILEHAVRAKDKTIAFVEGASHNFTPAKEAERWPGEFGDTVKNCFDFADRWLSERFL